MTDIITGLLGSGRRQLWRRDLTAGIFDGINSIVSSPLGYVAVGDIRSTDLTASGTYAVSANGEEWSLRNIPGLLTNLNAIATNGSVFVAVTHVGLNPATIWRSTDLVTWTGVLLTVKVLLDIAWGNGVFVAVGASGHCYRSLDGITWVRTHEFVVDGAPNNLRRVRFLNGLFVAVGIPNTIMTSPDGLTWTTRTVGLGEISDIAWSGERWFASYPRDFNSTNWGRYASSTDLVTWVEHSIPAIVVRQDLTFSIKHTPRGLFILGSNIEARTSSLFVSQNGEPDSWSEERVDLQLDGLQGRIEFFGNRIFLLGQSLFTRVF